jgi:hypothetical protein
MHSLLPILLLHCMLGQQAGAQDSPQATESRPRVIVHVNRSREVPAHVDYEDDEIIQIESLDGLHESWVKNELLSIIRLHDLTEPHKGVVITRNNQQHRGTIVRDGFDAVDMRILDVPLTLKRSQISHVLLEPSLDEQYLQRRLAIDPEDVSSHLALCNWLIQERQYEYAKSELEQVRKRHADPESIKAMRFVEAQLELHRSSEQTPGNDGTDDEESGASSAPIPRTITDEEVNLVRVYEIDLQNPPRLLVPRTAVRELIESYGSSSLVPDTEAEQASLYQAESIDIVRLLFRLRARELYPTIEVIGEPTALRLFRERVHDTWLMNNCSTSRCHGGSNSGRLRLLRDGSATDRVRYTNLLILDRFSTRDGEPLLDWENPDQSLLIQYGLPRSETTTPHPPVSGWKPLFTGRQRAMKDGAVQWMRSMMQSPRPEYPIAELTDDEDRLPR